MSALDRSHPLQRRYYRRVRNAMIAAALLHAVAFVFAPAYRPRFDSMKAEPLRVVLAGLPPPGLPADGSPVAAEIPAGAFPGGTRVADAVPTPEPAAASIHGTAGGALGGAVVAGAGSLGGGDAPDVFYAYDTAPLAIRRVEPGYPEAARQAGAEGTVVVNVNIDPSGRIVRAWVAQSNAPEALLDAALDAIYEFEFSPGKQNGIPVQCTVAVPFEFSLKKTFEPMERK